MGKPLEGIRTQRVMEIEKPQTAYRSPSASSRNSSSDSLSASRSRISSLPFNLPTQHSNEQVRTSCRELLMDYKELQSQLGKFQAKSTQVSKTNLLRLVVLRFLRLKTDSTLDPEFHKKEMRQFVNRTAAYGVKVLMDWWNLLLSELVGERMSSAERSVYLECISRIMARKEWSMAQAEVFSRQLESTLVYAFTRLLTMKTISLPVSAFIGKLFAFSYIHIDGFARILLFTLFVKNFSIHALIEQLPKPVGNRRVKVFQKCVNGLIDYRGDYKVDPNEKLEVNLARANCMQPPVDTSFEGFQISVKNSPWVKRWADYESDIFCSFLRHYLTLCFNVYPAKRSDELFHFPGFVIIYAHIEQVFNHSCMSILKFRQQCSSPDSSSKSMTMDAVYASATQGSDKFNIHKFISKLPIISYFSLLRSVIYECDENLASHVVAIFERLLLNRAQKITVYASTSCEVVYELLMEFIIYLQHDSQKFSSLLNWKFWISGLVRMIHTDYITSQGRALTYLFNIWPMMPLNHSVDNEELEYAEWISNSDLTLIYNITSYMISKPIWEMLFGHWDPLVRHFYMRLVVFKIIGSSSDNYGSYLNFKQVVKSNLATTYDLFSSFKESNHMTLINTMDLSASNPVPNMKFIITYMDPKALSSACIDILQSFEESRFLPSSMSSGSSTTTLLLPSTRTVYAYDIFDDAIYSSSMGSSGSTTRPHASSPSSPISASRSSSGTSLARVPILSSALSFFKKVGSSQEIKTQNNIPSSYSSPVILQEGQPLRTSPYLSTSFSSFPSHGNISKSPNLIKKSPSSFSSSTSSFSEISDEDFEAFLVPTSRTVSSSTYSRASSNSSSTSKLSHAISMEALPTPPELLTTIPPLKHFRLKFHLTVSQQSVQLLQRIIKNKQGGFYKDLMKTQLPEKPELPFETANGLFTNQNYGMMAFAEVEEDEDEFLIIPRTSTASRTVSSEVSFPKVKNYMLLGKFINEWNQIVEEYEKFSKIGADLQSDEYAFVDPLLEFGGPNFRKSKVSSNVIN